MASAKQQLPEAPPSTAVIDPAAFTFGAEHEWGDWNRKFGTGGCNLDEQDTTMVNSNGIAVDPKGVLYPYGGELNTPPFPTPSSLGKFSGSLAAELRPQPVVNYRSNLHIHVRVPGLVGDLDRLKQLQTYIDMFGQAALQFVEPIPVPKQEQYGTAAAYEGAMKRFKRRQRSHHTLLSKQRVARQMKATTLEEFYCAEVPKLPTGQPGWHLQPRAAINLRQLLQTNTIEFRHFPGTLDSLEIWASAAWCGAFLEGAFAGWGFQTLVRSWRKRLGNYLEADRAFPKFERYCHWQEMRYRATVSDGTVPKETIKTNIARFLAEGIPSAP